MTWRRWVLGAALRRRGRTAVAVTSIVLGVAIFVGVSIGARTLSEALRPRDKLGLPNNITLLQPTGVWGAEAPASAADAVRALPGVELVAPSFELPGVVGLRRAGATEPADRATTLHQVSGIDVPHRGLTTSGRPPAPGADEVAMRRELADALGVGLGDDVDLEVTQRSHRVRLVGLLADIGSRLDYQDRPVVTSLATAQRLGNRGDVITSVFVLLREGVDGETWTAAHRRELGGLQPAAMSLFESTAVEFFRAIEDSFQPVAAAALVLGAYLIFLTISRTVHERRAVHGVLRAVGASRGRIVGLVVAEAAFIGIAGTALGTLVGLGISRAVAEVMSRAFAVSLATTPGLTAPVDVILTGCILGLAAPVAAAVFPALRAARADPAETLRGTPTDHGPRVGPAIGGLVVLGAGIALTLGLSERLKPIGVAVALSGIVIAAPVAARGIGALARPALARLGLSGEVSARRLSRRPGRSATTAGLLATTLALVVVVSCLEESGKPGFEHVVETNLGADVVVADFANQGLSDETIELVTATPEVASSSRSAEGAIEVLDSGGRTEFLRAIDPATYFGVADFVWAPGTDAAAARRGLGEGGSVAVEGTIAERLGKRTGDGLTLQTLHGPRDLAIAGIYIGLGYGNTHAVVVSLADARVHFGLGQPTRLLVDAAPGADPLAVALRIQSRLGEAASVRPNQYLRDEILTQFDDVWGLVRLVVIVTTAIGLLGLVNTMVMEILDRRHELGVLRAIGAQRGDVGRLVSLEALVLGLTAGIVGIAAGSAIGWASVSGIERITRVPVSFRYPVDALPLVLVLALLAGAAAAIVPARRAAAVEPAEVLRELS